MSSRMSGYRPLDVPRRSGWYPDAAYWQRAGALMLDVLVYLIVAPLPAVLAVWWFGSGGITPDCVFERGEEVCGSGTAGDIALSRTVFYTMTVLYLLVYSYQVGTSRTLGRRATEYCIVDDFSEEPIGFARGIIRTLAMAVSLLAFGLGFLWPIWDKRNRTFHDMIAHTRAASP